MILLLLIPGVLLCAITLFGATLWLLRRAHASRRWLLAFFCFAVAGLGIGIWVALAADYQVSPTMRFASFPLPLAFFHLENGQWVDFPTAAIVMFPGFIANVLAVASMAELPLLLILLSRRRRQPGLRVA